MTPTVQYTLHLYLLVRRRREALPLLLHILFFLPQSVGLANHEEEKMIVVRCCQQDLNEEPDASIRNTRCGVG